MNREPGITTADSAHAANEPLDDADVYAAVSAIVTGAANAVTVFAFTGVAFRFSAVAA